MTQPAAAPDAGRLLGRSLLTLANVITVAAPIAADWNDSHIFNKRWPAHARFHGLTALAMATTLSAVNIWSVCGPAQPTGAQPGSSPQRSRWLTGHHSSWPLWSQALPWTTRRTRSHAWQAYLPIC
jgi:hypothetical protein